MSDNAPDPSPGGIKRKRGRDKNKQQKRRHEASAIYGGIKFCPRSSSGRPGSPHRHFEDSYDVVFDYGCCDGMTSPATKADGTQQSKSTLIDTQRPKMEDEDNEDVNDPMQQSGSTQVVHRHLNGLCIVTAGNVLAECATKGGGPPITVASVRYLAKASKDSQSARGKFRTKMKKQKRADRDNGAEGSRAAEEHNGSVSPRDPLCKISLSDGTTLQLKCCVAGTVIELNHRLETAAKGAEENGEGASNGAVVGVGDPSLLLKDPLLDGYLAVIMPARGPFPPTGDGGC